MITKPYKPGKRPKYMPPGTCFVCKDMPHLKAQFEVKENNHPWIVIEEYPYGVVCVMGQTRFDATLRKDKRHFDKRQDFLILKDTYPPLNETSEKYSMYVNIGTVACVTKTYLKEMPIEICCDGGDKMNPDQVNIIKQAVDQQRIEHQLTEKTRGDFYWKKAQYEENLKKRLEDAKRKEQQFRHSQSTDKENQYA